MRIHILLASLALGSCAGSGSLEVKQEARVEGEPLDEWIERLPPVGEEFQRKEHDDGWVLVAPAAVLHEHLGAGGSLSNAQWKRALEITRALRVSTTWPVDRPFAVGLFCPQWIDRGRITLTPRTAGFATAKSAGWSWCGNCQDSEDERASQQELGQLALGRQTLEFDVVIAGDRGKYPIPPTTLWSGTLSFEVDVGPATEPR